MCLQKQDYTQVCPSKYENGGRWEKGTVVEVVSSDSFTMQAWIEEQAAMEMRMTGARGPQGGRGQWKTAEADWRIRLFL